MNGKAKILTIAMITGICIAGSGMASGLKAVDSIENNALVLKEFDRIHIEAPVAADLAVMNVRVFGPDNELLLSTRTMGDSVDFLVDSSLPDGEYRYETVSIFSMDDVTNKSAFRSGDETMMRNFGSFTVSGGEIIQQDEPGESGDNPVFDEASIMDKVTKHSMRLAGLALDVLIPSAQAANLVASSGDPGVIYDDTDLVGVEWVTFGNTSSWGVADQLGSNNHWVFRSDGTANSTLNINSIIIDPDGDIHWGGNGLNYDRGGQALSLGTTAVRRDVTISSLDPAIDLFDESTADSMGINYDGLDFSIYTNSGVDAVKVNWLAPADSLHIQGGSGHVGLGTSSPSADLNIVAGNTAQIRVDNTTEFPAAGDQVMFRLQTAAANKVCFAIGKKGALWTFDNAGAAFQINLAGTGSNEFRVEGDGDIVALKNSYAVNHVNTSSRNSKTDFAPIDEIAILEKLSELPMSTWRYKIETEDERHLGPIAEDFQQAFGLSDGKHISTVDASGVTLTAIKGLNKVLQKRSAEIVELTQANSDLQKTNSDLISANRALDERLTRLENVLFHQNEVAVR